MDSRAFGISLVVLGCSIAAWLATSLAVLVSRARYDRRHAGRRASELSPRRAERLVPRVQRRPRTEWGRWRRVAALQRLERAHHRSVPALVGVVLDDPDERIAAAAIRTLGAIGDEWAVEILVQALQKGRGPRSRVASELEELAPAPGRKLVPLLRDWDPGVRFWAATLLGRYPDLAESSLVSLTWDPDVFGFSSGVVGLQLFKNRKFDAKNWSVDKYLKDASSVEPPYLVGMACTLCHTAFNPNRPPKNAAEPKWENLDSHIGSQYFREGMLFGYDMPKDSFAWHYLHHQSPGTSDTGPAQCAGPVSLEDSSTYLMCLLTSLVISNIETLPLPPNTGLSLSSALIMRRSLAS